MSVVWCPTGDMVGDFMTKPLQGALFQKFRDQIMGSIPTRDPGPGKAKPEDDKLKIHKVSPRKGKTASKTVSKSLVPPRQGRHHRSVLESDSQVTKPTSNGKRAGRFHAQRAGRFHAHDTGHDMGADSPRSRYGIGDSTVTISRQNNKFSSHFYQLI